MTPDEPRPRILYLHGLESGPQAAKVIALREGGFEVLAPALDTVAVMALVHAGIRDTREYSRALDAPLAQALEALERFAPDATVGSSFGAAVLLRLMHEHPLPSRPAVLLAGAGLKMTKLSTLPTDRRVVLVHGRGDEVIPLEHSRRLAASSARALLVEVHDDHRLRDATRSGLLCDLVRLCLRAP